MTGDSTGEERSRGLVGLRGIPAFIERVGWLLILVGFPMGNTTVGLAVLSLGALGRLVTRQKFEWGIAKKDGFYVWAWIFLGTTVLSAILSERPGLGLATSLAFFLMFFLLARGSAVFVQEKPYFHPSLIAYVIILSGIVAASYGIYTYVELGARRAYGISVSINGLGTVSAFMAMCGLGYFVHAWKTGRLRATLALLMTMLSLGALVLTYSRGAWLGFAASVGLLGFLQLLSQRRRRITAIVLLLTILVAGAVFVSEPRLVDRLQSAFSLEANQDRVVIWQATVDMIADHPLMGVGGGSFVHAYDDYRLDAKKHAMSFAHNIVLQMLAEFGILGFCGFAAVVGIALYRGWKLAQRSGILVQAIYSAYVGILVHEMVDNITYGMNVGGLFWMVTGLLVHSYGRMNTRNKGHQLAG